MAFTKKKAPLYGSKRAFGYCFFVFTSRIFSYLGEPDGVGGYCAGSDAGRLLYFSDAFLKHYQIGGDVPCSKEDILVVGGVICRKYLRWIINLLSRNLDCVENKRVKCERKNLFILIW